jgi:hypothetical protein
MKSFLIACAAAFVIAVGAALVLDHYQTSATAAFSTVGTRV